MRYTNTEKKKLVADIKRLRKSGKVSSIEKACKKLKVSVPTFYSWLNK